MSIKLQWYPYYNKMVILLKITSKITVIYSKIKHQILPEATFFKSLTIVYRIFWEPFYDKGITYELRFVNYQLPFKIKS